MHYPFTLFNTFCPPSISHWRYRNIYANKEISINLSYWSNFDCKINFIIQRITWDTFGKKKSASVATFSLSSLLHPLARITIVESSPLNEFVFRRDLTVKIAGIGDHCGEVLQLTQRTHDLRFLRLGLAHNRRTYLCGYTEMKSFTSHSHTSASCMPRNFGVRPANCRLHKIKFTSPRVIWRDFLMVTIWLVKRI